MDKDHGILQETLLYDESEYFKPYPACSPEFPALASKDKLTDAFRLWRFYIDN